MAYLATLTLDDMVNLRVMESKLKPSGRLDGMSRFLLEPFLLALREYLKERGPLTIDNYVDRFQYVVRDTDVDFVTTELMNDLEEFVK